MSRQKLICAWCDKVLRKGTEPASHGICRKCSAITFPNARGSMFRRLLDSIGSFFSRLFRRTEQAAAAPQPESAPAEKAAPPKRRLSDKEKRRMFLRRLLGRTDAGTKHYGSKRAQSNHRGSQRGKRSGRS